MRIAVGGFQHETNTFAPVGADFAAFEQADSWPALSRAEALFDAVAGINLPIAGFIEAARAAGHTLVPLTWCAATPSAQVTEDAFERVSALLLEDLAHADVDAVYLDLHGAMVAAHVDDGEGEVLRRVRAAIGARPLVASLDLHANITEEMAAEASGLVVYRTYPHVDMAETGARAARLVAGLAEHGAPAARALHKFDFLVPLVGQCTMVEPAAGLYGMLDAETAWPDVLSLSLAMGFPAADIAACGPSVYGVGQAQGAVDAAVERVAAAVAAQEHAFAGALLTPDEAVQQAMAESCGAGPVVIADTQDNPGGGGPSDTVGMLEALVRNGATGAVLALMQDPAVAAEAKAAGEGAVIEAGLGAKSGFPGEAPFAGRFAVERVVTGRFTATGPVWRGSRMDLGPMALLRVVEPAGCDVRVIVGSRKFQAADQALFRHVGIEPRAARILVLKSSVHFRADLQPIASKVLVAVAPGPNLANPADYDYRKLRAGVRLEPRGAPFRPPDR